MKTLKNKTAVMLVAFALLMGSTGVILPNAHANSQSSECRGVWKEYEDTLRQLDDVKNRRRALQVQIDDWYKHGTFDFLALFYLMNEALGLDHKSQELNQEANNLFFRYVYELRCESSW